MMKRLHATVRGRVQMVGFRYFVIERARQLRLSGWVRNGDDGATVEVVAEGPEDALRALESALREGPRGARVDAIDVEWPDRLDGLRGFEARW
jgi:acylphosphatase